LENVQNFKLYFETWKDMSEYLISDALIDSVYLYANREPIQTHYRKWTAVISVSIIGIPRLSFIICHFAKGYRLTNISDHPAPGKVPKKNHTFYLYGSFLWLLSMVPLNSTRNKETVKSNENLHCLFWAKTEIIKILFACLKAPSWHKKCCQEKKKIIRQICTHLLWEPYCKKNSVTKTTCFLDSNQDVCSSAKAEQWRATFSFLYHHLSKIKNKKSMEFDDMFIYNL
jgi:hypothetical protein